VPTRSAAGAPWRPIRPGASRAAPKRPTSTRKLGRDGSASRISTAQAAADVGHMGCTSAMRLLGTKGAAWLERIRTEVIHLRRDSWRCGSRSAASSRAWSSSRHSTSRWVRRPGRPTRSGRFRRSRRPSCWRPPSPTRTTSRAATVTRTSPRIALEDEHDELELAHGDLWCLHCHEANDRDQLHLADGVAVGFDESWRLCTQCHGAKLDDWRAGVHGKRVGHWWGPKQYATCVSCHRPHEPRFAPIEARPPPLRPGPRGHPVMAASAEESHEPIE
jgi:hypothetical protein